MKQFHVEDNVTFRESSIGVPETGTIETVIPADAEYPNGGLYIVRLDDGSQVEAWQEELTLR